MKCNFRVGQRVVCIKAFAGFEISRAADSGVTLPVKDSVYTIREFDAEDSNYIRLTEISNPNDPDDGLEPSFWVDFFRPVVERKTDISIFTDILNKQRTGVPA